MNSIILSYNNLPIAQQNNMFSSNNILLKRTPINQKPSNSSNTNKVLDPTLDSSSCFYNNNNINTIVEITPIKVDFYKEVIKTMDNFILLDFKNNDLALHENNIDENYYDSNNTNKVLNLDISMILAYYIITYPDDVTVDSAKLLLLQNTLNSLLN
jgi:hypothetical protein